MEREGGWCMLREVTERRGGGLGREASGRVGSWIGIVGGSEPAGEAMIDLGSVTPTVGPPGGEPSPPPSSAVRSNTILFDMSMLSSTPAAT